MELARRDQRHQRQFGAGSEEEDGKNPKERAKERRVKEKGRANEKERRKEGKAAKGEKERAKAPSLGRAGIVPPHFAANCPQKGKGKSKGA